MSSPKHLSSSKVKDTNDKVYEIVSTLLRSYPNETFVLVLYVKDNVDYYGYLQNFPNVHLNLADDHFIVKPKDREIVISWNEDARKPRNAWSICGHRKCDAMAQNVVNLRVENRVLIQIHEMPPWCMYRCSSQLLGKEIEIHLALKAYHNYYQTTFILYNVRVLNSNALHSSFQIRQTGYVIGRNIRKLQVTPIEMACVKETFETLVEIANRSVNFTLGFFGIFFPDGDYGDRFMLSSCRQVSFATYFHTALDIPGFLFV